MFDTEAHPSDHVMSELVSSSKEVMDKREVVGE